MKKVLALMLALVLVLSLVACGGSSSSGDGTSAEGKKSNGNEIEITLDNYNKYLKIRGGIGCHLDNALHVRNLTNNKYYSIDTPWGSTAYVYGSIDYFAEVEGLSQNFNYNDIIVTGKITGSCKTYKIGSVKVSGTQSFEKDNVEVECDITGKGSYREEENLSDEAYTQQGVIEFDFEVISISGTVTYA